MTVTSPHRLIQILAWTAVFLQAPQGLRRERRQSLTDLFRDLLNTQEQVLMTVCQKHQDLCQFGEPLGHLGLLSR